MSKVIPITSLVLSQGTPSPEDDKNVSISNEEDAKNIASRCSSSTSSSLPRNIPEESKAPQKATKMTDSTAATNTSKEEESYSPKSALEKEEAAITSANGSNSCYTSPSRSGNGRKSTRKSENFITKKSNSEHSHKAGSQISVDESPRSIADDWNPNEGNSYPESTRSGQNDQERENNGTATPKTTNAIKNGKRSSRRSRHRKTRSTGNLPFSSAPPPPSPTSPAGLNLSPHHSHHEAKYGGGPHLSTINNTNSNHITSPPKRQHRRRVSSNDVLVQPHSSSKHTSTTQHQHQSVSSAQLLFQQQQMQMQYTPPPPMFHHAGNPHFLNATVHGDYPYYPQQQQQQHHSMMGLPTNGYDTNINHHISASSRPNYIPSYRARTSSYNSADYNTTSYGSLDNIIEEEKLECSGSSVADVSLSTESSSKAKADSTANDTGANSDVTLSSSKGSRNKSNSTTTAKDTFCPRSELMSFVAPLTSPPRPSHKRSGSYGSCNSSESSPSRHSRHSSPTGSPHLSPVMQQQASQLLASVPSNVFLSPHTPLMQGNRLYTAPPTTPHSDGSCGILPLSSETAPFLNKNRSAGTLGSCDSGDGGGFGSPRNGSNIIRTSSFNKKRESIRKMHIRQKSVELLMDDIKGVEQETTCRDFFFALFFYAQLILMVWLGLRFGPDAIANITTYDAELNSTVYDSEIVIDNSGGPVNGGTPSVPEGDVVVTYKNVIKLACICGCFSVGLSGFALVCMYIFARRLIQVALCVAIGLAFTWGTIGIGLSPKSFVPISGIVALGLSIGYTFVVWDRIPFASSNLSSALTAVKDNYCIVLIALFFQSLAFVWTIFFTFTCVGIYDGLQGGDIVIIDKKWRLMCYAGMGISYYWTFQVLVHVVQVTVSGIVSHWWFQPDDQDSCCSLAASKSFFRASCSNFGSVCFGSLFVGPMQFLRQIAEYFRPNRDESMMCLQECLVIFQECLMSCVHLIGRKFNKWAFTYVGLYGYNFLEAGEKATALFEKRGWAKIVTDDLVSNVLLMVSLVIGGFTGCLAVLIEASERSRLSSLDRPAFSAFMIGLCVGLVLSCILFSAISSSVDAVIVCFAGSPVEFEKNHPEQSHDMRSSWKEVWPGSVDFVDHEGVSIGSPVFSSIRTSSPLSLHRIGSSGIISV